MTRRNRLAIRPRLESLEIRAVLSALTPAQLDSAYGLNAVTFKSGTTTVKGDGTGQTIAIIEVDHDANLATELATFDSKYGLATARYTVDDLAGSTTDAGWSEEEALDVEWAHAAAPGAKILVVEARSATTTDLLTAINAAKATAGVSVVSMSFGTSEFRNETSYDSVFTTPTGHTGITYIASAGDEGAGAEWPASSRNVLAVGGTTLSVTSTGTRVAESAWVDSGGGVSRYEAEPSYQTSVNSTGRRDAVDVSLDANPTTGVSVYSVAGGGWIQVGGTSLSAPVWAGLIAVADEGRALSGKSSLDGATQTLADLYAAPAGSFNDVTTGSRATTGYDSSTGLGTPNASALVAALVADPSTGAAVASTSTTTTTTTTTGTNSGTTSPTSPTAPPTPRYPSNGWWGFGGFFGYSSSAPQNGWGGPSMTKNSAQAASKSSTPHALMRTGTSWTVSLPATTSSAKAAAQRSVDVILASWGRAALS